MVEGGVLQLFLRAQMRMDMFVGWLDDVEKRGVRD